VAVHLPDTPLFGTRDRDPHTAARILSILARVTSTLVRVMPTFGSNPWTDARSLHILACILWLLAYILSTAAGVTQQVLALEACF
jgi:hypothetical protein